MFLFHAFEDFFTQPVVVVFTFLIAVTKYTDKKHLGEEGFASIHSLRQ